MKKIYFILICSFVLPNLASARLDLVTWKGTYYNAMPNKRGISKEFCEERTPGSFIHVVKPPISRPFITDRGIKLDRGTFHIRETHGMYLLNGDFWASGKINNKKWEEHIYWYFTKLTEAGESTGVWASENCKGLYRGIAIKDENTQV